MKCVQFKLCIKKYTPLHYYALSPICSWKKAILFYAFRKKYTVKRELHVLQHPFYLLIISAYIRILKLTLNRTPMMNIECGKEIMLVLITYSLWIKQDVTLFHLIKLRSSIQKLKFVLDLISLSPGW